MTRDRVFFFITALFAAIILTMLISIAKAEPPRSSTLYDPFTGKAVGRSVTDSQGTTTWYGPGGSVVVREAPRTGGTTIYDGKSGRAIGKTDRSTK